MRFIEIRDDEHRSVAELECMMRPTSHPGNMFILIKPRLRCRVGLVAREHLRAAKKAGARDLAMQMAFIGNKPL